MKESAPQPWRLCSSGLELRVRVTPRATLESVGGMVETGQGMAIAVRVRAAPQDGEANAAVERLIAGWLGIPGSAVGLVSGARSRVKALQVAGEAGQLAARVQSRIGSSQ